MVAECWTCIECGAEFERVVSERWKTMCFACWLSGRIAARNAAALTSGRPLEIAGKPIIGAQYKPACGQCDLPPWQVCECSFARSEATPHRDPAHKDEIALLPVLAVVDGFSGPATHSGTSTVHKAVGESPKGPSDKPHSGQERATCIPS